MCNLTFWALARRKPRRFNGSGEAIVALALACGLYSHTLLYLSHENI